MGQHRDGAGVWRGHAAAVGRGLSRHAGLLGLATAGAAVRIAVMVAYWPAFWYRGDSGGYLHLAAERWQLDPRWPEGYPAVLKLVRPTREVWLVPALQHTVGIAVGAAVYAYLIRRRVPRWLSCLAAAPLLLDAFVIAIEHYVLADVLYTAVLLVGVLALVRVPRPGPAMAATAGIALAAAWLLKPVAVPVVVVVLAYLLLRQVGWLPITLFVVGFGAPYLAVQVWAGGHPSAYGANTLALYGRTAPFADCERLHLTRPERDLCPAPQLSGQRPDWYAFDPRSPARPERLSLDTDAPQLASFAWAVISQQPVDYLRVVGIETAAHLVPGVNAGDAYRCLWGRYTLPATTREQPVLRCTAELAQADFSSEPVPLAQAPPATGLSQALAWYGRHVRTPRGVAGAVLVLAVVSTVVRRPWDWPERRDTVMFAVLVLAVIVPTVLVGMYEPRYALPALPFTVTGGALAVRHLLARS